MRTAFALHHLLIPLVVLVVLLVGGTLGYKVVGGWDLFDALYMTVITITTVGFHEVRPLGSTGRLFTMVLALGGVFTAFYAAAAFIQAVVTGEIRTVFIVAIKKPDGKMLFNPGPESKLERGDVLITLGHRQQLDRLESLAGAVR